jgi:hypothetical protein
MLEKLEEGEEVEQQFTQEYPDEAVMKYKAALAVMGAMLVVAVIIIFLMMLT